MNYQNPNPYNQAMTPTMYQQRDGSMSGFLNNSIWGRFNVTAGASSGGYGGVNPNDDEYASKTYANIIRQEYNDYYQRFRPYEQQLISLADSQEMLDQQLGMISANATSQFNAAKRNSALMNQRYGIQQTDRESNYFNAQAEAEKGLAVSQAKNMSRMADYDRRMSIMSGSGLPRTTALENMGN